MTDPGLPLAGMRVVEISAFLAAPLGGMTLAQLGAEVIRIDPLGGAPDHQRWPVAPSGKSFYWAGLNKGKKSVSVDLNSPEGQQLVTRLITEGGPEGGIVLTNSAGRDWLSYDALAQLRPDLIHVQIEGHNDGSSAVDYTVNASVGFPMVTGPEGHDGPVNHVLPAWDIACGLYAALSILGADRQRRLTGRGQKMNIALYDVALAAAGNLGYLAEAQLSRVVRERNGNYVYGTFARDFTTRDGGRVMLVALTKRHWRDLIRVTGLTDVVEALERSLGVDFAAEGDRFRYREVLAGLLGRWFSGIDLAEVKPILADTSLLWSTFNTFADLVADHGDGPPIASNPLMFTLDQPGIGEHLAPGLPVTLDGSTLRPLPAPALGEHTDGFLEQLGLSEAQIADLHMRDIVRGVVA